MYGWKPWSVHKNSFFYKLRALDDGAYDVLFEKRRYLFRKSTKLNGKLIKFYAEELGGNDFISGNYYVTRAGDLLKPCEMPAEKVVTFVEKMKPV